MGERGTIVFDLDGTLVDSAPDLADALDELLIENGLEPLGLAAARKLIGHGISNLVRKGLAVRKQELSREALAQAVTRFQHHYAKRLPAKATAYPGASQCLSKLAADGWRLAVCTNKLESFSRAILKGLDLEHFFAVVAGRDTFGVAKPDPQHLLRTLPANRSASYQAIMVGDSEVDVETAKAARMPIIAVTFGYAKTPLVDLAPDALVDSYADIPAAILRLSVQTASV
jgi:phosphoglycolate phosphatase